MTREEFRVLTTRGPVLLDGAIKAAIKHPEAKVLN